jgi:hypothetical protein
VPPSFLIFKSSARISKVTGTGVDYFVYFHVLDFACRDVCVADAIFSRFQRRFNLRRQLKGLPPVTECHFDSVISSGNVSASSSISGSDCDSDSSSDFTGAQRSAHDEFANFHKNVTHTVVVHATGARYTCWATLFDVSDDGGILPQPAFWSHPTAVILCSGGHFAATIFERERVVRSKTFHKYVVRAKQVTPVKGVVSYRIIAFICSLCSGRQTGGSGSKKTY